MMKIEKLEEIIRMYDELMGYWFDGVRPNDLEEELGCVYELSDTLRNEGLEIVKNLKEVVDKLQ